MVESNEAVVVSGPEQVALARILTLRAGLKLEIVGMKRHGRSCYSIIKDEFGFRGSKAKVLSQLEQWLDEHVDGWQVGRRG